MPTFRISFIFLLFLGYFLPTTAFSQTAYVNVKNYGAWGTCWLNSNYTAINKYHDDTQAFRNAISNAGGQTVYVPAGYYCVSSTLNFNNINLVGDGANSVIMSTSNSSSTPIIAISGQSRLSNITIRFAPGIVPTWANMGYGGVGEYVGIQLGNFNHSSIRDVNISDVGTGIYEPYQLPTGLEEFSNHFDSIWISRFQVRGIDLWNPDTSGDIFSNIHLSSYTVAGNGMLIHNVVDRPFSMYGQFGEVSIHQLNVESLTCSTAISLTGVRALAASSIHIEGVQVYGSWNGLLELNNTSGQIDSLTVYYTIITSNPSTNPSNFSFNNVNNFSGQSIIWLGDGNYDATKGTADGVQGASTSSFLKIGTLHLKGLNDPSRTLYTQTQRGLNGLSQFNIIYRGGKNAQSVYKVRLDNYYWETYQGDSSAYGNTPSINDLNGTINFTMTA